MAGAVVAVVGGVVVVGAVVRSATDAPSCPSSPFPTGDWRRALRNVARSSAEHRARSLARRAVQCEHLVGRTPTHLLALLGAPTQRSPDHKPVRHDDWSWTVGRADEGLSSSDAWLFAEVYRGKVVYAEAPGGRPNGGHTERGTPAGR